MKGTGGKSGGRAWTAVELIAGDLLWVTYFVTENIERCSDHTAEVSRGRSSRVSGEGPNDKKGQ
jgi:hypothetical protein